MKWFKHLSGSLNDSLIFEAIEEFGSDGYLVFFGTLEILADELDIHQPGRMSVSMNKLKKNFQLSRQKIAKILSFFDQKAKINQKKNIGFFAEIGKTHVDIYCPKFERLCDEYTRKKQAELSGVSQEFVRTKSHTDTDTDTETDFVMCNPAGAGHDLLDQIILKCETIREFSEKYKKTINIYAWVQIKLNDSGHPGAIIESMDALINKWKKGNDVTSPWAYLNATFMLKNGNYWEDHHIRESQKFKEIWTDNETIRDLVGKIGREF